MSAHHVDPGHRSEHGETAGGPVARRPARRLRTALLTLLAVSLPPALGACFDLPTEPPVPAELAVSDSSLTFSAVGETAQLVATVIDQHGETITDATVSWTSSVPSVADVSVTGLVTAHRSGETTIGARVGSISATVAVRVLTPLMILTTDLPPAAPGVTYGRPLEAEGGARPYSWSLTQGALPAGLELNTSSGSISGTPTGATSTFTVTVTSAEGESASKALTLEINFTVNTTDDTDDGACQVHHCSLREALTGANGHAGTDVIHFAIPGSGTRTIRPRSRLPDITGSVVIDGYTQPGAHPNTLAFPGGSNAVLRIELDGEQAGASTNGLWIRGGASVVRGLVINRFGGFGLVLSGHPGSVVEGNFIGTDPSGTFARGNGTVGVGVSTSGTTVGGTAPAARNLISANHAAGIQLSGVGAGVGDITVQGNLIGTDVTGTQALGNASAGVAAFGNVDSAIGGTTPEAGNIIAANGGDGVLLAGSSRFAVQGNFIGTDADGSDGLGNLGHGVDIVRYTASIGPFQASDNTIGGTAAGAGNVIRGNGRAGVFVTSPESRGNAVLGNAIFSNGGLGIDLGSAGVDANDAGDADAGSNDLQNYPVISLAEVDGDVTVTGYVGSTPQTELRLEVFANDVCDGSGHGEAQTPLGSILVTTNADGTADFSAVLPSTAGTGAYVTATATGPGGNTSELSACTVMTSR